ncbi:MAG: NAD(P)-dependent oxidoreductase, partial [Chamaesiphon sp. CSU_1_12]|nr:NAD(P)-dependent oxidoreductase [Chamaesiphon sp. CSU_1_12]
MSSTPLDNCDRFLTCHECTEAKVLPLLDRGAIYAQTPQQAAAQADIIISMTTDDRASRSVWLDPDTGAVNGLRAGAIAIESSTLTVDWTQELAAAIDRQG